MNNITFHIPIRSIVCIEIDDAINIYLPNGYVSVKDKSSINIEDIKHKLTDSNGVITVIGMFTPSEEILAWGLSSISGRLE